MSKSETPSPDPSAAEPVGASAIKASNSVETAAKPAISDAADKKSPDHQPAAPQPETAPRPMEIGGPKGPEPTRFGDWERDGRCVDF